MAITNNTSDESGDVFIIRSDTVLVGLTALTDFVDTTTGSFNKEFRYTTDGINYSDWTPLTQANLQAVDVVTTDTFVIEYRYTSTSLSSSFTDVSLEGEFEDIADGKTYQNSIFATYFSSTDNDVLQWCVNVTNKLYKRGIVPNFIKRGEESNLNGLDRDYIDFWRTVACFFAYIVILARQMKNFRNNEILLDEFLHQRGIFFCEDQQGSEKNYLVDYYFDEIRQRGTSQIYKTKAQTGKVVDGELLRSICFDSNDEFLFNLYLPHNIGWSIGNSSPMYKGLIKQSALNKSYEDTEDFVNLSLYPTFGNGGQTIGADGSKNVYQIQAVPAGEIAGIGDNDTSFAINVDPNLSYEITFWVRQPIAKASLTFGALSYDRLGNSTTLRNIDTGVIQNNFFERALLANTNDYFFIRGIIYNKDASGVETDCFGGGNHLKMTDQVGKIIPYIVLDNSDEVDSVNRIRIWDLKIRPLSTNYSTGFVNPKNFISIWAKHNNATISRNQLERNMRRFLLPYDTSFKVNYLNEDFAISS